MVTDHRCQAPLEEFVGHTFSKGSPPMVKTLPLSFDFQAICAIFIKVRLSLQVVFFWRFLIKTFYDCRIFAVRGTVSLL